MTEAYIIDAVRTPRLDSASRRSMPLSSGSETSPSALIVDEVPELPVHLGAKVFSKCATFSLSDVLTVGRRRDVEGHGVTQVVRVVAGLVELTVSADEPVGAGETVGEDCIQFVTKLEKRLCWTRMCNCVVGHLILLK